MPVSTLNTTLQISQADLDRVMQEAKDALPHECCGILVGRRSEDATRVERTVSASNITEDDKARNYQVDWRTLFDTVRQTRDKPEEIVGFYHSHPDGSAEPSTKDAELAWPDFVYVIVCANGTPSATAWQLPTGQSQFETLPIAVH